MVVSLSQSPNKEKLCCLMMCICDGECHELGGSVSSVGTDGTHEFRKDAMRVHFKSTLSSRCSFATPISTPFSTDQ